MPIQKPHRSDSTTRTPDEFFDAVRWEFGITQFEYDLAANETNNANAAHTFTPRENTLLQDWGRLTGDCWLNPPYDDIEPWVKRCAKAGAVWGRRRIFLLVPASVGSVWFQRYVHDNAVVYFLAPRIKFVGHKSSYPKDLVLAVYGEGFPEYRLWRWK